MLYLPCRPIPVAYVPRRKAMNHRQVPNVTIGVYCVYVDDMLQLRYTTALDIDKKVSETRLRQIVETVEKMLQCRVCMVCETCKGYHIYVNKYWYNVTKLYTLLMKLTRHVPEIDKYQIRLGWDRSETYCGWMIIRVGGKYDTSDINVIQYEPELCTDDCHRKWIEGVREMIEMCKRFETSEILEMLRLRPVIFR